MLDGASSLEAEFDGEPSLARTSTFLADGVRSKTSMAGLAFSTCSEKTLEAVSASRLPRRGSNSSGFTFSVSSPSFHATSSILGGDVIVILLQTRSARTSSPDTRSLPPQLLLHPRSVACEAADSERENPRPALVVRAMRAILLKERDHFSAVREPLTSLL